MTLISPVINREPAPGRGRCPLIRSIEINAAELAGRDSWRLARRPWRLARARWPGGHVSPAVARVGPLGVRDPLPVARAAWLAARGHRRGVA